MPHHLSSRRRDFRRDLRAHGRRGGTSFVELALVLPVLLAILMGVIDFGWLARNTLTVANAAREGARAAALGRTTADIKERIGYDGAPTLQSSSPGVITNGSIIMEHSSPTPPAGSPAGSPLVYTSWPADIGTDPNKKNGVPPNNYVRITVNYTHRSITGLFNRTVSIPVMMRREG